MYHRVYASKYRQEIISLVWDFQEQLTLGDSINYAAVDVIVSSGTDSNPSEMILGFPVITGTVISQQIRRGIPGTIYTITITAGTVGGDYFEDVCYLAILPRLGPLDVTIWETTQLYSLDSSDSMQGFTTISSGWMSTYYGIPPEKIQGYHILDRGVLQEQIVRYSIPHEDIQGFTKLISGTLSGIFYVTYPIPHEDIQGFTVLISGVLTLEVIRYTIPHEDIQGFTILTSGDLTT